MLAPVGISTSLTEIFVVTEPPLLAVAPQEAVPEATQAHDQLVIFAGLLSVKVASVTSAGPAFDTLTV